MDFIFSQLGYLPLFTFLTCLVANIPLFRYYFFNKIRIKARKYLYYFIVYLALYLINIVMFSVMIQNSFSLFALIICNILFFINLINFFHKKSTELPNLELEPLNKVQLKQGKVKLGFNITPKLDYHLFNMNIEDIKRHILIYGQTGSGKTTFVKQFLYNFCTIYPHIKFILFEFKGEYPDLANTIPDTQILIPGENFTMNLFENNFFPKDILAEIVFDSFKSCQILDVNAEFSPQMEYVLINVLKDLIQKNSEKTWSNFFTKMDEYVQRKENQIPQIIQTAIGIKNRLRRYSEGPLKKIFTNHSSINSINELFNHNYIIDLGNIIKIGGNKEDIIFFSNLILKVIWHFNVNKCSTTDLDHITIFEDCSYLASKKVLELSKLTSYLEDIALLLRGKGESLITITTTLDISKNIILNSGSKFFFKFNEKPDDIIFHLGLTSDNKINMNSLSTGLCIAKIDSIPNPFLMYVENRTFNRKIKTKLMKESIFKPNNSNMIDSNENKIQNRLQKWTISLFYFDQIEGELCFYKNGDFELTDSLENQLSQLVEKNMGNYSIKIDGFQHFIFHFELNSHWARGGKEFLSIIVSTTELDFISRIQQESIPLLIQSTIETLQTIHDCYKGFYIANSNKKVHYREEIEKYSISIKKIIKDTFNKLVSSVKFVSNSTIQPLQPVIDDKTKFPLHNLKFLIENLINFEQTQAYKN